MLYYVYRNDRIKILYRLMYATPSFAIARNSNSQKLVLKMENTPEISNLRHIRKILILLVFLIVFLQNHHK